MWEKDDVGFKKKSAGAIYRPNIKPILIWSSMEKKNIYIYIYIGFSNEDGHNDDDVDLNMKK
jgi:hypothetical protein